MSFKIDEAFLKKDDTIVGSEYLDSAARFENKKLRPGFRFVEKKIPHTIPSFEQWFAQQQLQTKNRQFELKDKLKALSKKPALPESRMKTRQRKPGFKPSTETIILPY